MSSSCSLSSQDVCLHGVSLAFGSLTLLQNTTLKLSHGQKYALVGRNGIGKSTLLRCIHLNQIPQWTPVRTYFIQQEFTPLHSDDSPLTLVTHSDPDYQALLKRIQALESSSAMDMDDHLLYQDFYSRFDDSQMNQKAIQILKNLQFTHEMMHRPFKDLSGGWRMRTLLACAVFVQPDLLLMDEPTNHLDLEGIQWLIHYLKSLKCTLVVVSHDRDFLDSVVDCVIHLTQKQLRYYPGNYTAFVKHRQEKLNEQSNTEKRRQRARANGGATKKLLESNSPKLAKMTKKNMIDTAWKWGAEALLVGEEGEDERPFKLQFPDPDFSVSDPLVQLKDISFAYDEKDHVLWEHVDLTIQRNSRMALLGRNGLGKSSLLKCIAGLEQPLTGLIYRHHNLRMAVFTQYLIQDLDLSKTPVESLMEKYPESLKIQTARDYLGSFGIRGDRALMQLGVLSGGQRTRFVFALLCYSNPHLLLLDEPTSHLDMEMTEALIDALKEFKGAIVFISHHCYFVTCLECECFLLEKKRLVKVEWKKYLERMRQEA